jgi:hypothetical protein
VATRSSSKAAQVREHIAKEAARLMVEGGIQDYGLAKRKAAQQLRVADARQLPRNDEIERALHEYQRLFRSEDQPARLRDLRATAGKAMRFLDRFAPRLVGPGLTGTADSHSAVCLHGFAETAEEVSWYLTDRGIAHGQGESRVRMAGGTVQRLSTYSFLAGETKVELVVFAGRLRRQQPLSPVDGRPMERASLARLEVIDAQIPRP